MHDRVTWAGRLGAAFFLVLCWTLAPFLESALEKGAHSGGDDSGSFVNGMRVLLAEHCYQKSQAYFHSGAWFSIFDHEARGAVDTTPSVLLADGTLPEEEKWRLETPFAGRELDWLDSFGRNFFPQEHTHLTSGGATGEEGNLVYEMLPWLELAVHFDPHFIVAYEEADYWLRKQLERPDEAEGMLRRGLAVNPDSYRLLFLLGQIALEHRNDNALARRRWEMALVRWERQNQGLEEPDLESFRQIAAHLATLEEREGRLTVARALVQRLRPVAVRPAAMDRWLAQIDDNLATRTTAD